MSLTKTTRSVLERIAIELRADEEKAAKQAEIERKKKQKKKAEARAKAKLKQKKATSSVG